LYYVNSILYFTCYEDLYIQTDATHRAKARLIRLAWKPGRNRQAKSHTDIEAGAQFVSRGPHGQYVAFGNGVEVVPYGFPEDGTGGMLLEVQAARARERARTRVASGKARRMLAPVRGPLDDGETAAASGAALQRVANSIFVAMLLLRSITPSQRNIVLSLGYNDHFLA
jgi:hypothetical protein